MRIALCVHDLGRGGGQIMVVKHANALARTGRHHVYLLVDEGDRTLATELHPAVTLVARSRAAELAEVDVALASWWETALWVTEVRSRAYGQFVQSLEDRFAPPGDRRRRQWSAALQTAGWPTITEASWIRTTLGQLAPTQPCFLVRNGIDKAVFPPTPPRPRAEGTPLRVLVEGSSAWFKGTRAALAGVAQATAPIDLTYVASWADWQDDGLVLPPNVHLGERLANLSHAQLAALMRECDVLVKVPLVEGMPGPPLEAMHCGATVIATRVTGIEEYAVHGDNALLVGFDDTHAIGRWLDVLYRRPDLLHRLRGQAYATALTWPSDDESGCGFERAVSAVAGLRFRPTVSTAPPPESLLVGLSDPGRPARPHDAAAVVPIPTARPASGSHDEARPRMRRLPAAARDLRRWRADPSARNARAVLLRLRRHGTRPAALLDAHWYSRHGVVLGDTVVDMALRGAGSNRSPHPLFDPRWYREQATAVGLSVTGAPFGHYLSVGFPAGLAPHPYIDAHWYWQEYPLVREAGIEPITHFTRHGVAEGRTFSGWLDAGFVAERYAAALPDPVDALSLLRFVMADLVPRRRPTAPGQSPLLDILDGRRMLAARAAAEGSAL